MLRKGIVIVLGLFLLATVLGGVAGWFVFHNGGAQKVLIDQVVKNITGSATNTNLIQDVLGYSGKRTYLVLFLNNTELRPGGGFIGAYGVVTVENGSPTIVKVDGTENLDRATSNQSTPPVPLTKYLKITNWQFRDSNWSPDFPTSASTSLTFYKQEGGALADNVDGVVAFTPTILEELLKIIGPITVAGETFNADNAVEKLEYAVEYGYSDKGFSFKDRKQTLALLVDAVFKKIKLDLLLHWSTYYQLGMQMLQEKQILLYSSRVQEQLELIANGWAGQMRLPAPDYLLWADANLGALKTDAAMKRTLSYTLTPTATGYIARATMHYKHTGSFNWRTTRYLDYPRIFVPKGSTLVSVESDAPNDTTKKIEMVAQGTEGAYTWFGGFTHIEPGREGSVTFTYVIAPTVAQAVQSGHYNLMVQKQAGTHAVPLTLSLDFGTPVKAATPAEPTDKYGDSRYDVVTDLRTDREFSVSF